MANSAIDSLQVFSKQPEFEIDLIYEYMNFISTDTRTTLEPRGTFAYIQSTKITKEWISNRVTANLRVLRGGTTVDIVIPLGVSLSPYYIAYDLTRQLRDYNMDCVFLNNYFYIRSGHTNDSITMGTAPTNDGKAVLGFTSSTTISGTSSANYYTGTATLSGFYTGIDPDTYYVTVSATPTLYTYSQNASNYYKGTMAVGGYFTGTTNIGYTITVSTTNGNTAYNGLTSAPTFTVVSTSTDNTPTNMELLYYDSWYAIGDKGIRVKFSEYPFKDGDTFYIECNSPTGDGDIAVANAHFVVYSEDGIRTEPALCTDPNPYDSTYTLTLPKGVTLIFTDGYVQKGDTFIIKAYGQLFTKSDNLNLGLSGAGEYGGMKAVRVVAKQGIYKLRFAKIAMIYAGPLLEQGWGKSEYKVGFIGKVTPKNTNELVRTTSWETEYNNFHTILDYLELNYYVNLAIVNNVTDPFYIVFRMDANEITQEFYPVLNLFYNYV